MNRTTLTMAALLLIGSSIACCTLPKLPEIDINVPTIEVGEIQSQREEIPLSGAESATVDILFGAGKLKIEAGTSDQLLAAHFRYNVEQWEPEITYEEGTLTIRQGSTKEDWGIPTGNTRNEWELELSPDIPLDINIDIGAGEGELDFSEMQIVNLDLDMGAGDFQVRFDEANETPMSVLRLDTGASKLEMVGIGYASPEEVTVNGGVGDITLDLTGRWRGSADVQVTAGVGSVTLRLPDDIGVQVETEGGLTNIEADGFERDGDRYVNDAFGETEIQLLINVTTGIGSLRLVEVSND